MINLNLEVLATGVFLLTAGFSGYLVYAHKRYRDAFLSPTKTWKKLSWKKTIFLSLVALFLFCQFVPAFESHVEDQFNQQTINPKQHNREKTKEAVEESVGFENSLILIGLLTVALVIFEEIIYRGLLMDFFKNRIGLVSAILINSAIFSISHMAGPGTFLTLMPVTFVASVIFSLLYWKGGIITASVVHGGYDILIMLSSAFGFSISFLF